MLPVLLAFLTQVPLTAGIPADSVEEIRKAARRAESAFERLARSLVPLEWGRSGTRCDEIVGRFCLTYDSGTVYDPPPEDGRVVDARRTAIEALRLAFSYEPHRLETSGPLVRYLVEDERASEAVSAARTYAALSRDSIWGPLLLGFALHGARDDTASARLFAHALARLPVEDAERIRDIEWLMSSGDRGVYGDADAAQRERLEQRLWRFADPLYLTPGNESWTEHVSRHVWSRLLEMTPLVRGVLRWGRDLEQLTVRYGVPAGRTRTWGTVYQEGSLVEHYHPDQLAYFPEDLLDRGAPPAPLPGDSWELERSRSRSGFAPLTLRRLQAMSHQVTRFPAGDAVLVRVDGAMPLDTLASGRVETGLWLLRDGLDQTAAQRGSHDPAGDTVRFHHEAEARPGEYVYSIEALDGSRLAARARYGITIEAAPPGPALSDPLVARPYGRGQLPDDRNHPALDPFTDLVFTASDTIGLFAEIHSLEVGAGGEVHFRVDLSIREADRDALPARIVSWLGQRLGLSSPSPPPRVSWEASAPAGRVIVATDVRLDGLDSGNYVIVLDVADLTTARRTTTRRIIRLR
jgi:hypothetical protein